ADALRELGSVHLGHHQIDQAEVERAPHLDQAERVRAAGGLVSLVADCAEYVLGKGSYRWLIVDDQNGWWQHGLYIGVSSNKNTPRYAAVLKARVHRPITRLP